MTPANDALVAELTALLKKHIVVDATGLAPIVVGHFIYGFEEAARAALDVAVGRIAATERARCVKAAEDQALSYVNGTASTPHGKAYQHACLATAAAIKALPPLDPSGVASPPKGWDWKDIALAPKDTTILLGWCEDMDWPEAIKWVAYDPADAEEIGEAGYWTYAEQLLAETTDEIHPLVFTEMPAKP